MASVQVSFKTSEYANRVLGVVKETYGLKDKGQALARFAEMFGREFIEPPVKPEYAKKLLKLSQEDMKKHGYRPMTKAEFDDIFSG